MKKHPLLLTSLALALTLTGCKMGPNYKRPVVNTPATYRGAQAPDIATDATKASLGDQAWSEVFRDPVLQNLVREALQNNFDARIAAARVLEQQAQVSVTRAAQFPTLSGGGTYNGLRLPGGLLGNNNNNGSDNSASNNSNNSPSSYYAGGLTASAAWNLDFWGLYRRQTEAARAQLLATQYGQRATQTSIIQNVVSNYLQLRAIDAQLELTRKTIETREQSLKLTETLERGGSTSLADVRQAEQLLYTAKANIPSLEQQIQQQENAISLLLGRNPGPIERGQTLVEQPHPTELPAGIPSHLLERRADIMQAEETLVAANAQIGAARAQYFPQISLSGQGGSSSSQLKKVFDSSNVFAYFAGSATEPIFDGGKIRANYRLSKAAQQEMLFTYQKTIAGALRDVSNSLTAYQKTREFREQQALQVNAAADAVRLARIRYQAGSTSYLEVLTNDATLYTAQLTLVNAQQQEAMSLVQVYSALGGGWQ